MRAPRGTHYLRRSERLCEQLFEVEAPQALATAYALSNFAIGSATTAHVTSDERTAEVDPQLSPSYARPHRKSVIADAETIFIAGAAALLNGLVQRSPPLTQCMD